jgi:hypothetical protein
VVGIGVHKQRKGVLPFLRCSIHSDRPTTTYDEVPFCLCKWAGLLAEAAVVVPLHAAGQSPKV